MRLSIEGVMPPHITPFDKDEEVDEAALRKLIHFWLDGGASGLVSCGSNGEAPYLTRDERRKVIQTVVDEVDGKVPVIAGTGAPSTRETIVYTKDAKELGADAALIVSPYYFKPDKKELLQHYKAVLEAVDIPVLLYNVPKFTGYNLEPSIIVQLANEYDQIVAVKDSGGSIGQISDLASQVGGRISVLSGSGDLILPTFVMGGKGAIVAVAIVAPSICADIYRFFKKKDVERAVEAQRKALRLNEVLIRRFNQISSVKEALSQLGQPAGYPRRPSLPLDEESRQEVRKVLSEISVKK